MEELIVRRLQNAGWHVEVGYDVQQGYWAKAQKNDRTVQTGPHRSLLAALEDLMAQTQRAHTSLETGGKAP